VESITEESCQNNFGSNYSSDSHLVLTTTKKVIEESKTELVFSGFVSPQVLQKLVVQAVFTGQVLLTEQETSSQWI